MRSALLFLAMVGLAATVAACGGQGADQSPTSTTTPAASAGGSWTGTGALPQSSEKVTLDPADFTTDIDNAYWPMASGSTWVYRETDQQGVAQRVDVTVTDETKMVMGIEARVIHDVVTQNGQVVEDTLDWYAQDKAGNVWYLGEDTKEYENGKVVSTEGSWEAGVDGAQPGIIMPAQPEPGVTYRQEYYSGQAEDAAAILSATEWVQVTFGSFRHVLLTKDFTPLQPEILEYKFYARDVGPVLVLGVSGGATREELVTFERSGS
jgi:hypothetical protein